jgi:GT2 family glycosyltransferase
MTVAVAVVVKDRREQMRCCLDALAAQSLVPDELLVVDNGSTDGTLELVRERGVRVVQQAGPLGRARQAAVDATSADLLAFTDSDCRPRPGWLAALVAAATPDVAVVQGRTVAAPGEQRRFASTQEIGAFSDLYECCNLLYRTEVLREAGGFDSSTGFFGEDTAAGWRVRRLAGRGAFAPDAVVEHDVTHPGAGWHLRRGLQYAAWPRLVREFPEMRTELLHHRWFLQPRRVRVTVGLAAVAGAGLTRRPLPLVAALPWAAALRPTRPGRAGIADSAAGLAFDVAVSAGLLAGAVKEHRVVL